ncbi:hypothetical protein AZE42_13331 [Rhizopogon vesiculosus]|uniref:Uncharacterized protein n=1 Tax=Rhizopogon vesiculosus TaxID=180088 RepID=A0A1J8QV76_9AGAM|nr:hypothetical protein AZE42_13331 [Rhizopogon vesiculosus]
MHHDITSVQTVRIKAASPSSELVDENTVKGTHTPSRSSMARISSQNKSLLECIDRHSMLLERLDRRPQAGIFGTMMRGL